MSKILHILNGDSAIESLGQSGIEGDFLSWLDVLHDGPVPSGHDLHQLSVIRAKFIAERAWAAFKEAMKSFDQRDQILRKHHEYEEVVIWNSFELFDQLHLMQLLDWFDDNIADTALSVVFVADYLGRASPQIWQEWYEKKQTVTTKQLKSGKNAWRAFTSKDPTSLHAISQQKTDELPFLKSGLLRLFEEFPDSETGLSRTEMCIMHQVEAGESQVVKLFPRCQKLESVAFMGDWSFWKRVGGLVNSRKPLLKIEGEIPFYDKPKEPYPDPIFREFRAHLTEFGIQVLKKNADALDHNPHDFWIGGVHLNPENDWRWDNVAHVFTLK